MNTRSILFAFCVAAFYSVGVVGSVDAKAFTGNAGHIPSHGKIAPLHMGEPSSTCTDMVAMIDAEMPLSSSDMDSLRGGFADPRGLFYNFAVNVQTQVNGATIFSRALTVMPSAATGQLEATANMDLMPQNLPSGLGLSMVGNGNGVLITNPNGSHTTVLNQTAGGAPASIIMNTMNGQNIKQTVTVGLTLHNMATIMNFVHNASIAQVGALAQHSSIRNLGF